MAISSYSAFNQFNQPACRQAGKAFTIVELLVVFAITAILFTSLVFYSRSAERQVIGSALIFFFGYNIIDGYFKLFGL